SRMLWLLSSLCFFFSNPATSEIYTLSLHDALPICRGRGSGHRRPICAAIERFCVECVVDGESAARRMRRPYAGGVRRALRRIDRSEEHTSELQSPYDLVCRLLLEKKKQSMRSLQSI